MELKINILVMYSWENEVIYNPWIIILVINYGVALVRLKKNDLPRIFI